MKKVLFLFACMLILTVSAFAQNNGGEIDLGLVDEILMTGIGGMTVTALVALFKRWLKAEGLWVVGISIVVAGAATALYIIPLGFEIVKFLVIWALVALAANGYHLKNIRRMKKGLP